ncbi:hypothetical protein A6R68_19069, partial [Neotoma lepida]
VLECDGPRGSEVHTVSTDAPKQVWERPYYPRDCASGASPKGDLETCLQRSARDDVDSGLTGDWKAPSGDHGHLGEEEPGSPDQIP